MAVDQTSRTALNAIDALNELKGKLPDDQNAIRQNILDLISEIKDVVKAISGRSSRSIETELTEEARNKEVGQQIRYADGC